MIHLQMQRYQCFYVKSRIFLRFFFLVDGSIEEQFHHSAMGRLRRDIACNVSTFQFHSGAIKTARFEHIRTIGFDFQFHSGAIKTQTNPITCIVFAKFQFHSGAIKTAVEYYHS